MKTITCLLKKDFLCELFTYLMLGKKARRPRKEGGGRSFLNSYLSDSKVLNGCLAFIAGERTPHTTSATCDPVSSQHTFFGKNAILTTFSKIYSDDIKANPHIFV